MKEVIGRLPSNKATRGKISFKILKESGFTFECLTCYVNEVILSGKFPNFLKLSNVMPVHKEEDPTDKFN